MAFRYLRLKLGEIGGVDDNRAAFSRYFGKDVADLLGEPDDKTFDVPLTEISEAFVTYDPQAPEHKRFRVEAAHDSPIVGRFVVATFDESHYGDATSILKALTHALAEPEPDVREVLAPDEQWRWSLNRSYFVDGKPASLWVQQPKPEPAAEASADA